MNTGTDSYINRVRALSTSQQEKLAERIASLQGGALKLRDGSASGLSAFVVLHKGETEKAAALREALASRLPDFMVPSRFVVLDSLPLTANGKVDRSALTMQDQSFPEPEKADGAPQDNLEVELTKIWKRVLGLESIGRGDNFFELGGHSLLVMQLVADIKKELGKDLPIIAVFNAPTIKQLAGILINEEKTEPPPESTPAEPQGLHMPLFWVTGANFTQYLEPDQPVYQLIDYDEHGSIHAHSTVEEIASLCVRRIFAQQSDGPYLLGGYCFWGTIALEVAQQLKNLGHKVPLLFLVDTSFNYVSNSSGSPDEPQEATGFISAALHHVNSICQLENKGKRDYIKSLIKGTKVFPVINMIKAAVCKTYLMCGRPLPNMLIRSYVYTVYATRLVTRYPYQGYSGDVVLITSTGDKHGYHRDWTELVKGSISVNVVPDADHWNMIREPQIGIWARWINDYLRNMRRNNPGART